MTAPLDVAVALVAVVASFATLAVLWLFNDCSKALAKQHDAQHAMCIAAVAAYVGDAFAARVLDAAAEDYDSVDGRAELGRLGASEWSEDGPSIPALWLSDRADRIYPNVEL